MNIQLSDGKKTVTYTIDKNTSLIGLREFIEVFSLVRIMISREIIVSISKLHISIISTNL